MIEIPYTNDERDEICNIGDKLHNMSCHLMHGGSDEDFAEEISNLSEICWKIATSRDIRIPERILTVTNTMLAMKHIFDKNDLTTEDMFYVLFECTLAYHYQEVVDNSNV